MKLGCYYFLVLLFLYSCSEEGNPTGGDPPNPDIDVSGKIYVTDQGSDRVIVLDATSPTLDTLKTILIDYDTDSGTLNIPHFIEIDETNRFWFVTAFGIGKVGMYNLEDDSFINSIDVGSSPALMVLDESTMTLYVSRMMPMGMGMEGGDNELFKLSYEEGFLVNSEGINLVDLQNVTSFPSPHALSISDNSTLGITIYTASNTADILAQITNDGASISYFDIDPNITDFSSGVLEIQRLNPIQAVQSEDYVFITCSANSSGQWQTDSGDYYDINGQVVMFDILNSNSVVDTYEFSFAQGYHSPWHVVKSPVNDEIYITLGSGSVACLEYNESDGLTEKWILSDAGFGLLHGITVDSDGSFLYVSSRDNGSVHKISASSGDLVYSKIGLEEAGMMGSLTGIAIVQE